MDRCLSPLLFLLFLITLPAAADERARTAAELEAVRERIEALQVELRNESSRKSRAEQALQEVEKAEQSARRQLQQTREKSAAAKRRETALRAEAEAQQAAIVVQQAALANQMRMAYINGDEEWLRVMLSQQDAAVLGRRMTYYGYLSRQRKAAIEQLRAALAEIAATQEQIEAEVQQLARLELQAADKLEDIANTRAERAELLARIRKGIATRDQEIAGLKNQEAELGKLMAALAKRLPAMPNVDAEPFAGQTRQLSWPVDGPVLKAFGQPRADGSLRWNGVLLGAKAGTEVRAVYHGRVVFSDWLAGMGLLTIVEHDGGYMSLYGHNQDLLKEVGEWVMPGEAIAHVGDSGGQVNAGLYFEIRKDGQPVNPRNWVK